MQSWQVDVAEYVFSFQFSPQSMRLRISSKLLYVAFALQSAFSSSFNSLGETVWFFRNLPLNTTVSGKDEQNSNR